ncbi:hypothetical protein BC827DRAFT_1172402 [Russula dissimulans]|nr:hypothetical protein BC827DRAFT_1172402 [Russula dissimulans]
MDKLWADHFPTGTQRFVGMQLDAADSRVLQSHTARAVIRSSGSDTLGANAWAACTLTEVQNSRSFQQTGILGLGSSDNLWFWVSFYWRHL